MLYIFTHYIIKSFEIQRNALLQLSSLLVFLSWFILIVIDFFLDSIVGVCFGKGWVLVKFAGKFDLMPKPTQKDFHVD